MLYLLRAYIWVYAPTAIDSHTGFCRHRYVGYRAGRRQKQEINLGGSRKSLTYIHIY